MRMLHYSLSCEVSDTSEPPFPMLAQYTVSPEVRGVLAGALFAAATAAVAFYPLRRLNAQAL